MAQYKYFIFILVVCLLLTVGNVAKCDSADQHMLDECRQTLHLCNDSNDANEALVRAQSSIIDSQASYISGLEKEVASQSSALPSYAWVIIGVAVGVTTMGVLK